MKEECNMFEIKVLFMMVMGKTVDFRLELETIGGDIMKQKRSALQKEEKLG